MDLAYSPEYEAFRAEVRSFLEANKDKAPKPGAGRAGSRQWQQLLIQHGYAARTIPKEYGGAGLEPDILKSRILAEEFARAKLPPGHSGDNRIVPVLLELGTEEQRERYVPPTVRGEMMWCQGYSEPGSGSDLASLSTKAHVDGDDFVINGQKIWTSGAKTADMMFCLVRTEADAPKHQGISYLLIPM
ncbi:MAG: acyl-CoA dehydrogenase family protein, partial [Gammaproteobacteria bacterium]